MFFAYFILNEMRKKFIIGLIGVSMIILPLFGLFGYCIYRTYISGIEGKILLGISLYLIIAGLFMSYGDPNKP